MVSCYSGFASVYDRVTDDSLRLIEALDYFVPFPAGKNIIDFGCGTGKYTVPLCRRGFRVTALDPSDKMLAIAASKCREMGFSPKFVCSGMQDFKTHGFDVVFSADTVNSFLDKGSLRAAFRNCFDSLKDGGLFIFDLSTSFYYSNVVNSSDYGGKVDGGYFVWDDWFDGKEYVIELNLFFPENGLFRREKNVIKQRCFDVAFIKNALFSTGFSSINCLNPSLGKSLKAQEFVFFVAKK